MKPKILILEDDPHDAELLRRELSRLRCAIEWFSHADAALAYLHENLADWKSGAVPRPDLALVDLRMPGTRNGLDLLLAIKMHYPILPIVIVSGYPDPENIRQALALGYFGLIEKPVTTALVREIFAAHRIFEL